MSYTPKTWNCGDTITAEDLNHIEQGIANAGGGGTLIIRADHLDEESGKIYYDKTWQDVYSALAQGKMAVCSFADDEEGREEATLGFAVSARHNALWAVSFSGASDNFALYADSADGYLYLSQG